MPSLTPVKQSSFLEVGTLTTSSFLSGCNTEPSQSIRISAPNLATYINASQFKSVPGSSGAAGNLGDLAASGTNFYFHNGSVWVRLTGTTF